MFSEPQTSDFCPNPKLLRNLTIGLLLVSWQATCG